ncbi:sodium/proline symporter PutP [Helicobacter heilmannii]|uniref:Sodium/proline symporter n=1 Tax=Helicobacter heilmannii TaxID=35817 RepID=A0A0K2Y4J8_HELHE|nr:sodium/proline symporter PutP [Helicobacter heilmannii]BDQ27373.1 sodium/proline symporter [Helicobacter heilmannii]CCM12315.1 Proline/sodium symporter PutP (TC 2.A.21.2.1) @ Propionate/sodium symporter [Helicobacter heilmannii ASB1.4]CRI34056.1 Proline/sodium symporter PutP (TC 2.A.21.2.1) @ Propionate/sodium symporter [Helicobacter heilmannii]
MQISYQIVIVFVLYSLLMLAIGFYFYKNNETTEDYFLGDRSMGPVVSALSAGASDMSGWLLMGLPGALYVGGLINSHIAIGLTIGSTINWVLVAKRLRVYTSVIDNSITIPDYFETRFSDDKHILRLISAVVILIFFTFYVSSGLVSGAKLFEATFGVKYNHALITGTLIIVTYTFLGGYKAVCWTDLIQGLLMMGALVAVPCMMLYHLGGFKESFSLISQVKPSNLIFLEGSSVVAVISSLAWGLGYFGQPHILVRFMSIRSIKEIPQATTVGISWMAISLVGSCLIGLLGVAYVAKFHLNLADPEKIFIHMSADLFNPWISGVLLSAILAAVMSTASSQLLVSSSTIAEDFYSKIFNKNAPVKTVMLVSRASVLAVALIAFFISTDRDASVLKIVSYAWAGFGASFGTVILFSLFWARMTRLGAITGMVFGAGTVILYDKFGRSILDIYEIVPGFITSSLAIIIFSLLGSVRPGTKDAFDLVMKEVRRVD